MTKHPRLRFCLVSALFHLGQLRLIRFIRSLTYLDLLPPPTFLSFLPLPRSCRSPHSQ